MDIKKAFARPEDNPGFATDGFFLDHAPFTRIARVVAVIAHDKDLSFGDGNWAKIVAVGVNNKGVAVDNIGFFNSFTVSIKLFIPNFNNVAGSGYNPFNKIDAGVFGEGENNNIALFRLPHIDNLFVDERDMDAIAELRHKEAVADVQGIQHGARRDVIGLNDETSDNKRDKKSAGYDFDKIKECLHGGCIEVVH